MQSRRLAVDRWLSAVRSVPSLAKEVHLEMQTVSSGGLLELQEQQALIILGAESSA